MLCLRATVALHWNGLNMYSMVVRPSSSCVRVVPVVCVRMYLMFFFRVWGESIHNMRGATEPASQFILTKIATRARHNQPHARKPPPIRNDVCVLVC